MTTIYFAGGEDYDFTKLGACSVDTATTSARRTANARCSLKVNAGAGSTDGWSGTFSAPQSAFWLTARYYATNSYSSSSYFIQLKDASGVTRLTVDIAPGLRLSKVSAAGSVTSLATTAVTPAAATLIKVDMYVNYGASGTVQLYLDGTLVLSYSGNTVTDSATAIASVVLGGINTNVPHYWSEVICADVDTRSMSLVTLAPTANGNTFNWDAGSYANINETTLDDTGVISSGTVGQVAQFTVGSSGITGNSAIKAVCVTARASAGTTGPQHVKASVRTGGADYASATIALQSGSLARIQGVFLTNPATGNAWVNSDVTAAGFNVGLVSDT